MRTILVQHIYIAMAIKEKDQRYCLEIRSTDSIKIVRSQFDQLFITMYRRQKSPFKNQLMQ